MLDKIKNLLNNNIVKLLLFAAATRIFLVLLGCLSIAYLAHIHSFNLFNTTIFRIFRNSIFLADPGFYLNIAKHGYTHRAFSLVKSENWAFYPLWPLLMSSGKFLGLKIGVFGIILSNLFFFSSIVFLYKLIRLDFKEEIAFSTCIFLCLYPWAHFFLKPMTESLFLLLVLLSFYSARKDRWSWAAVFTALATLTKVQGILVFLTVLYMYFRKIKTSKSNFSIKNLNLLVLTLAPLALLGFMAYLYSITGNFFASFDIQKTWNNTPTLPFAAFIRFYSNPFFHVSIFCDFCDFCNSAAQIFVTSLLALLIFNVKKFKIPFEYILFTLLAVWIIISRTLLLSSVRFACVVFPLYLILALYTEDKKFLKAILMGFSFILMGIMFILFSNTIMCVQM